jgi:hypothetical protein
LLQLEAPLPAELEAFLSRLEDPQAHPGESPALD